MLKLVMFVLRVRELADRIDVLPRARVERILGVRDGRSCVFGIEIDEQSASRTQAPGAASPVRAAQSSDCVIAGGVVSISNRSLTFSPVSASPGVCEGASDATTLMR